MHVPVVEVRFCVGGDTMFTHLGCGEECAVPGGEQTARGFWCTQISELIGVVCRQEGCL